MDIVLFTIITFIMFPIKSNIKQIRKFQTYITYNVLFKVRKKVSGINILRHGSENFSFPCLTTSSLRSELALIVMFRETASWAYTVQYWSFPFWIEKYVFLQSIDIWEWNINYIYIYLVTVHNIVSSVYTSINTKWENYYLFLSISIFVFHLLNICSSEQTVMIFLVIVNVLENYFQCQSILGFRF